MVSNRQMSLKEVVSIEAWYQCFSDETRETDFFLHIKFQDGIFGADPNDPVRFKIRLKRAVVVVIPEDPIKVPKASVRRDRVIVDAKKTIERRSATNLSAEANGEVSASSLGLNASAQAKFGAKAEKDVATHSVETITHSGMTIEHSVDDAQNNVWTFAPAEGTSLYGQAFNETGPLMKLTHKAQLAKLPAVVKVRVSCLREDIEILNLEAKDDPKGFLRKGMGEEKKLRLAEEIIKDTLATNGLEFGAISEKFSRIHVADVIATEEI